MSKSKVIHFRRKGINRCVQQLTIGNDIIEYVNVYKYLGVYFNEYMGFEEHCKLLAEAGIRALGSVIGKFKSTEYIQHMKYTQNA